MSAGTITLTNGSAIVGGSGTSFATELAAGDFIVSTVGGVDYTLPVKSVESNTQLTLVSNFTGPTQSGAAWSAVPRVALNMVTAALVAQSAEALRGLNYDKQNWQQVYSAAGNITVKLPDGTTFTGPSWKYLSDNMATKSGGAVPVNQGGTGSTTASGARTNLGLGNSATRDVGSAAGTVAAGDDSRLKSVDGKTGGGVIGHTYFKIIQDILPANGCIVASTTQSSTGITPAQLQMFCQIGSGGQRYGFLRLYQDSSYKDWYMDYSSGNAYAPASWVNNSDRRIKDKITPIDDPLGKMKKVRGYTWVRKDDQMKGAFGIGFVAQEIQEIIPEAVCCSREGSVTVDGEEIENSLALSPGEIAAALHHEAILALMEKIDELTLKVEVLQSGS
ncbi:TPA: tail fiber domain-containing protein [Enterobacter roggenkampii]|uniref:tail fiber domain-containing protein n=2 Tax=Enterobacter roggenkampii TaxID=1812935 RepID=UPI00079A2C9F|nr:tail fiber domain-containing protein [Enterobacter roggenkampii]SAA32425.1 Uncharacterised protein [Enterobacter roggenkampii]HCR0802806.1 tail fiber domain-containing protein [Enterobacter roggenkampii]